MPPIVGFQTYLSNAQRLISQDAQPPKKGEARPADCTLGLSGRKLSAVPANGPSADIELARRDFIESFVVQFGEGCRPLVESALLGKNAKPLTARMIVALNEQAIALKPSDLTASLSDLLHRAAQENAGGVTHAQFQVLIDENPELRAELEPLNAVRKQAEEALARLGAFTGAEIAAAFRPGAAASREEQALKDTILLLVRTATNKLLDLADGLRRIYSQHGDETGMLFGLITRCNNRAIEVQRMVAELSQLDSDSDDLRLSMYAAELLPKIALQMHGTGRAIEQLSLSLQPLANRFDSIRAEASRDGRVSIEDVALLLREITVAQAALRDAAKHGIEMPDGSKERPDPGLFKSIDELLNKLKTDVLDFTTQALEEKAKNWVNGVVPTFSATKLFTVYRDVVKDVADDAEEMERFLQDMEAFRMSALVWARGLASMTSMAALNDSFLRLQSCLKAYQLATNVINILLSKKGGSSKRSARTEHVEEVKAKVAELKERFQKLGEMRVHELEKAADEDRVELDKLQNLLENGSDVMGEAVNIQRLYEILVGRREESEEERESNGSGV